MPVRFNTDRALFEAFPTARRDVGVEPQDRDPIELARELAAQSKLDQAASLCAYLLSRRDAVEWGCRSLRALHDDPRGFETPCLKAAEAWVGEADETRRDAARDAAAHANDDDPTTWLAKAAAWSGGSLVAPAAVPVPAHLTAVAVRVALSLALRRLSPDDRLFRGRACIDDAARLATRER